MHRSTTLASLRETIAEAGSGFTLMGHRVTLQALLSIFYIALTSAIGIGVYLHEDDKGFRDVARH